MFLCFSQGEELRARVKKICDGYRATLYPCPDTPLKCREVAVGVASRMEDLKSVLRQAADHRHRVLLAAAKNVRQWLIKVRKIKVIHFFFKWRRNVIRDLKFSGNLPHDEHVEHERNYQMFDSRMLDPDR